MALTGADSVKRRQILAAATERFGRDGYDNTKWADIAADVGVGPTALCHYCESKQHCLYLIIDQASEEFRARFADVTAAHTAPAPVRVAVLQACFVTSAPGGLGRRRRAHPDRAALVFGEQEHSHAALHDRARRLATVLAAAGVRRGDRVALLLHNGLEFPEALLACHVLGAVAVPVNFRLAPDEIAYI